MRNLTDKGLGAILTCFTSIFVGEGCRLSSFRSARDGLLVVVVEILRVGDSCFLV